MKLSLGRKNIRTLYVQLGDEPSDDDPPVGFAVDWHTAMALCLVANAHLLGESPEQQAKRWEHLAEMARMANFVRPLGAEQRHGD